MDDRGEIIIYQTEDGLTKIDVSMQDETVWLTQYQGPSSTTYCTGCAPWVALCLCSNICMPMCCGYGSGGYYPGGSI